MKRNEVKDWMVESLGITEPSTAQVSSMMSYLNDLKRNTIVETTEKISKDYEGWISPKEADELKEQIDNYETEKNQFGDYEELKAFKSDVLAKEEEAQKLAYLKSVKVKDPYVKMVMGQLDWSKAKYDKENKTYTGLDEQIASSKETYKDLYEQEGNEQIISFEGNTSGNGGKVVKTSSNSVMNSFIRGEE